MQQIDHNTKAVQQPDRSNDDSAGQYQEKQLHDGLLPLQPHLPFIVLSPSLIENALSPLKLGREYGQRRKDDQPPRARVRDCDNADNQQ